MGPGQGEAYSVDLYAARPSAAQVQTKMDEDLTSMAPAVTPADAVIAEPLLSELPQVKPADISTQASSQTQVAADAAGASGQVGATSGAGDDLWNAIAPCWRRVADSGTLPVTLEVTFSQDGHLAKPPVIERDAAAGINPQSLQSEAKAIAALANCGAYAMAAGKAGVKVSFPKPE